jgi:hypothetical protein
MIEVSSLGNIYKDEDAINDQNKYEQLKQINNKQYYVYIYYVNFLKIFRKENYYMLYPISIHIIELIRQY